MRGRGRGRLRPSHIKVRARGLEHRKLLVNVGGRWGADGLRSGGVGRLPNLARNGDVGANDLSSTRSRDTS